MGLFDTLFGSSKKKRSAREDRRRRDGGRRRIDDEGEYPDDDRRRRRSPDDMERGDRGRRSKDGRRRRRPPEDGGREEGRRRRRPDDEPRREGRRRSPPPPDEARGRGRGGRGGGGRRERRERPPEGDRPPRRDTFEDDADEDVFVIKPEGDKATVERKKGPSRSLKDGKFEIAVGSPTLTGEGTTGEGGILQTVLKSKVTGDLKPTLKEARLKKVEKTITDIQMKVQSLEESTGVIRSDLSELKETVSRMEIAINDVEDIKEEYNNMEKSLRELSALYDLLSSYTNPFIESIDLPKRTQGVEEAGASEEEGGEDADFEFEELSSDINPFVEDLGSKGKAKAGGKQQPAVPEAIITGEPAEDLINKDFWMLKWAKYISAKVHASQVHKLLGYYRDLGWIDQETQEKMLTYFDGSKIDSQSEDLGDSDTIITEDGKVITEESEDAWKMSMDDHSKSLEFIGKIKTNRPIE